MAMPKEELSLHHDEHGVHHSKAREKFSLYNYGIVLCVSCSSLATGMVNGMINTTLGQPSFLLYFGFLHQTKSNTPLIGTILGVFFASAIFGCAWASYSSDKIGRKKTVLIAAIISIVSTALVAGSVHIAMLIIFRGCSGFASGAYMSVGSLLQSELAPPRYRGLMVGLVGVMISFGYVFANWLGVAFYFVEAGGVQWRIPFAICTAPSFLTIFLLPVIPESPRWLVMKNRTDEARAVISKLHGHHDDEGHEFAELEVKQMVDQISFENQHQMGWWELLLSKRYRKRFILTIITQSMSQSAGIVVIASYGPTIYASLGFGTVGQLSITAGYVTFGAITATLGTLLIDSLGRVPLLAIGTAIQIALIVVVTPLIVKYAGTAHEAPQRAIVAMFYIFELGYCMFVEGASYTYVSEMWPAHLRAKGSALGVASIYLVDTIYVEASLYAFVSIGWKFYLVFIVAGVFFLTVFLLLAKETKGKPLEEIAGLFGDQVAAETLENLILTHDTVLEETKEIPKGSVMMSLGMNVPSINAEGSAPRTFKQWIIPEELDSDFPQRAFLMYASLMVANSCSPYNEED
ncbi:hypothetical protein AYL99_07493 [Fonsecaea erecta]|uniref:Major facilitator superfamily (MFS) profile domain-containing protein n=1 Tax=Fonsecaea erecta TaxID=1367422 RepID=A0A178ZGU1_9EURO|nr:hypothetical protein AYL99_07493 [Fonsecaea erecta]OAP58403.1 hypothetical protein AYL99_07493 [Fonsecaea erecta]